MIPRLITKFEMEKVVRQEQNIKLTEKIQALFDRKKKPREPEHEMYTFTSQGDKIRKIYIDFPQLNHTHRLTHFYMKILSLIKLAMRCWVRVGDMRATL